MTESNKTHNFISPKLFAVISAVVFAVIFLAVLVPLSYILRPAGDTKTRFMGFYAEPEDSLDIVMIGSSPTYSCCVTPELYGEYGIKAYPLASNVQRPVAGKYLVKEAEKTQSPALYMFEMRMYVGLEIGLTNNMAYTREVTDNIKYSRDRVDLINAMLTDSLNPLAEDTAKYTYYFDIFKYHSNWSALADTDQWRDWRLTRRDPHKGYKITGQVGPVDTPDAHSNAVPMELESYQEQALTDLLAYLDEIGAHALFYVSPYVQQEDDAEKYAHIRDVVETAGYDYLDMNQYYDEIGLDFSRDFSDYGIHTNAVGAQKCTIFLGEYLKSHYELPDHRAGNTAGAGDESDGQTVVVGGSDGSGATGGSVTGDDRSWDEAYALWLSEYPAAVDEIEHRIETEDFFVFE